jgi:hypothetical protein
VARLGDRGGADVRLDRDRPERGERGGHIGRPPVDRLGGARPSLAVDDLADADPHRAGAVARRDLARQRDAVGEHRLGAALRPRRPARGRPREPPRVEVDDRGGELRRPDVDPDGERRRHGR